MSKYQTNSFYNRCGSFCLIILCSVTISFGAVQAVYAVTFKRNLIIHHDAGIDDMVAITYLLNQPNVNLLAITIASIGNANCCPDFLTTNYLVDLLGHLKIVIACGHVMTISGNYHFSESILQELDTLNGLFNWSSTRMLPLALTHSAVDLLITKI